ncbi:MFS transporter [Streptomyces sp. INA 01156]
MAQLANALPASLNGLFQQDLGTHGSQLTWITASFMIAVVVFEFTFGVLGDLFGRRKLIASGAALIVAGSIVSAVSPTVQWLWVGAALNGLAPAPCSRIAHHDRGRRPQHDGAGPRHRAVERLPVGRCGALP